MIINPGNLIITEAKGRGECKISFVNISNWQPISNVYCLSHAEKKSLISIIVPKRDLWSYE